MAAPEAHIADLRQALQPARTGTVPAKPVRMSVMTAPPSVDRLWIDAEVQAWRRDHRLVRCTQCENRERSRKGFWFCTQDGAMCLEREQLCMVVKLKPEFREARLWPCG